jgi:hypothetical protein
MMENVIIGGSENVYRYSLGDPFELVQDVLAPTIPFVEAWNGVNAPSLRKGVITIFQLGRK